MTTETPATLGKAIAQKRKEMGLSQKELAEKIMREEDQTPISPQYLNDIEHDRRKPSSDHMMKQFSTVLGLSENYLYVLADRLPAEMRNIPVTPAKVDEWVAAFRRPSGKK